MTNTGRKATAALVAALVMMAAGRASANDEATLEPLTIEVVTVNQARIPRETVERAEEVATHIFLAAGIRLEWTNTAPDSVEPYRETAQQIKIYIVPVEHETRWSKTRRRRAPGRQQRQAHIHVLRPNCRSRAAERSRYRANPGTCARARDGSRASTLWFTHVAGDYAGGMGSRSVRSHSQRAIDVHCPAHGPHSDASATMHGN